MQLDPTITFDVMPAPPAIHTSSPPVAPPVPQVPTPAPAPAPSIWTTIGNLLSAFFKAISRKG
jgi:hypothetical protein